MNFDQLITNLHKLNDSLKVHVVSTVNSGLTMRNWIVGAYIVEYEQHGMERAKYGEKLILEVSKRLAISGLPATTLRLCRTLYQSYPEIQQTMSADLIKSLDFGEFWIQQTPSVESASELPQSPAKSERPDFAISIERLI